MPIIDTLTYCSLLLRPRTVPESTFFTNGRLFLRATLQCNFNALTLKYFAARALDASTPQRSNIDIRYQISLHVEITDINYRST